MPCGGVLLSNMGSGANSFCEMALLKLLNQMVNSRLHIRRQRNLENYLFSAAGVGKAQLVGVQSLSIYQW